jgi:predicted RNA-binding protein YlxR (DUF448 family)
VCRQVKPKRELTRLVMTPEGVRIDSGEKLAGRGAYLCSNPACWEEAARGQALARALRAGLTPDERATLRARVDALASQQNE